MKNLALSLTLPQNRSITGVDSEVLSIDELNIKMASKIIDEIMNYRRFPKNSELCGGSKCQSCSPLHLSKIYLAVKSKLPVTFILPAFPGKSPNSNKVLGILPDYAERLSLHFLGELCRKIKNFYSPGIKIVLCSDGRVFSDVVGIKESSVTAYQMELGRLIEEMLLRDLSVYNLDNFYEKISFAQMREELMKAYGKSLDFLKHKVRSGGKPLASPGEEEANRMYCGITRFLFEDAMSPGQSKSRSVIQKDAKSRAYEVIRRSNAWSDLIAERFPEAIRLSIHPQTCGSKKLGIRLVGNESWMTPWHGVAVETRNGYILLKRSEAEKLGSELIYDSFGDPSHYRLIADGHLSLKDIFYELQS